MRTGFPDTSINQKMWTLSYSEQERSVMADVRSTEVIRRQQDYLP
jgi:hypothetical protein